MQQTVQPPSLAVSLHGELSVHATLVAVHGRGVLICGAPATGKSRLALAMLSARHRLVADDLVLIRRNPATDNWRGRGVPGWLGTLAPRGEPPRDIRAEFGDEAALETCVLHAVVTLDALIPLERRTATHLEMLGLPRLTPPSSASPAAQVETIVHWLDSPATSRICN